jgi:outer membrane biosynthesis protein TonB
MGLVSILSVALGTFMLTRVISSSQTLDLVLSCHGASGVYIDTTTPNGSPHVVLIGFDNNQNLESRVDFNVQGQATTMANPGGQSYWWPINKQVPINGYSQVTKIFGWNDTSFYPQASTLNVAYKYDNGTSTALTPASLPVSVPPCNPAPPPSPPPPPAPVPTPTPTPAPKPTPTPKQVVAPVVTPAPAPVNQTVSPGDTSPPSVPQDFSASVVQGSVALEWSASTDDTGVDHYLLERSTNQQNWSSVGDAIGGITYSDGNVDFNTTYYYRLSAYDTAGNHSDYATVTVKTSSYQANVLNASDSQIKSDDGLAAADFPAGTFPGDAVCIIMRTQPSKATNLVTGPYQINCKGAEGDQIGHFNQPVSVVLKAPNGKNVGSLQAVSLDGGSVSPIKATVASSKDGTLTFKLADDKQFGTSAKPTSLMWLIWALVALVLGGVAFWFVRRGGTVGPPPIGASSGSGPNPSPFEIQNVKPQKPGTATNPANKVRPADAKAPANPAAVSTDSSSSETPLERAERRLYDAKLGSGKRDKSK